MFAVIETGGKQYLVETGTVVTIEKLEGEVGTDIVFDKVLLLSNDEGTSVQIGTPYLSGVTIGGKIQEQGRAKKIRVVKYKRKVRYKRVHGHRQHQTRVLIGSVA